MALKALDKTYESFFAGDVVVHRPSGAAVYGVQVLKKVFIEETNEYHFICAEVDVKDNKVVISKSGGQAVLAVDTAKSLRNYNYKWTPGEDFKSGDVLKDQDGILFIVAGAKVWNLSKGTQTTQANWEEPGTAYGDRQFTKVRTIGGQDFSAVLKVEDVKTF